MHGLLNAEALVGFAAIINTIPKTARIAYRVPTLRYVITLPFYRTGVTFPKPSMEGCELLWITRSCYISVVPFWHINEKGQIAPASALPSLRYLTKAALDLLKR
jgi:hypothetical protein